MKQSRWILIVVALFNGAFLGPLVYGQGTGIEPPAIDVSHYDIEIEIDTDRSYLTGKVVVQFTVLQETLAIPFSLNKRLSLLDVLDQENRRFSIRADDYSKDRVRIQGEDLMRPGETKTLTFVYEGMLEKEDYAFLDVPSTEKAIIDPKGALLLSEGNWFPSHRLPTDSATAVVRAKVPLGFTAVAPGVLGPIETVGISEVFTWRSEHELNGVPLVASRFYRQQFVDGSLPVTCYVTDEFKGDLNPFFEAIDEITGFYREIYGSTPIEQLTLVQVGKLQLGSSGASGLMLLESQVLEAKTFPRWELALRLASQWWGYSVRIERPMDAWLQGGFSAYAALQYFEMKRPDEFKKVLARNAIEALKYQDTAPIVSGLDLEVGSARYGSIVESKGAWVLYMLGQLMGEDALRATIAEFYAAKAGTQAAISEFVKAVEGRTGENYKWFFVQWIESVGVPEFRLDYSIYKERDGTFKIRGQVRQNLELFRMPMDIQIETKGQPEEKHLNVSGKSTSFEFQTQTLPVRLQMDPQGKVLMDSDRMRIAVHVAIGDEYRETGEYASALDEYEKAVDLNARSSLGHFRLGQVFFEQHSYSSAANSMRDSLNGDLKPEWVETWAHIYLGKVYDILGQRQRARSEYKKALNSGIDYNGAQAEAQKYYDEPFSKPDSVIG